MTTNDANLLEVNQRVAMVSGASRGIGEAIARRLLDDGYRLSLGVRDTVAARETFPNSKHVLITHFDALEPGSASDWVDATLAHFGGIDALVNNAGIWKQVNFEEGSEQDLDAMWEVNVKAPFRLTRLALPHLRKCGT
ncbi:MAG: SDR family NAD(P)-dependent oxidoreductase, partial [Gammaproteobacteria bacterium]|nr:SDR family NAD(P)-dependent oxidoreductase [Gammaproteobacteria bacterium]